MLLITLSWNVRRTLFSLHDLGWESHTLILMFLRKLGRYLCILGTIKWMNDVLWLDIRCLQAAEAEEWLKKPCSCTTVGRKMTLQSRSGSGQYLVVGFAVRSARMVFVVFLEPYLGMVTLMMVSHWGHETQGPIIWSFKDSGLHFLSLEAVKRDPGWLSAAVITTCQLRFSLPLKSHPLFFTSFAKLLRPLCCCGDNSSNALPVYVTLLYL